MANCLIWIFGRGASAACKLNFTVPKEWQSYERNLQIALIREAIQTEMDSSEIDTSPYRLLLSELASRTNSNWHHRFLTTNWDFLLQREIEKLGLTATPRWLPESHVYHINGTVEEWPSAEKAKPPLRSPFLLESDLPNVRIYSEEVSQAIQYILWRKLFVVVGMSFECLMDRALLEFLANDQDNLPIGFCKWILINNDKSSLEKLNVLIKKIFINSEVISVQLGFMEWLATGMPELLDAGVLKSNTTK